MTHTGTLTSPRKPKGRFKPRQPSATRSPAPTSEEIKAAHTQVGTEITRKKNHSQRMFVKKLFPALFSGDHPLPMEKGIKDAMLTSIVRRGLDVSEARLQAALRACCASLVYRARVCAMRFRRDIDGKPVEAIEEEDKNHAWQKIVEYRARHQLPQLPPVWKKSAVKKRPAKPGKRRARVVTRPGSTDRASKPTAK